MFWNVFQWHTLENISWNPFDGFLQPSACIMSCPPLPSFFQFVNFLRSFNSFKQWIEKRQLWLCFEASESRKFPRSGDTYHAGTSPHILVVLVFPPARQSWMCSSAASCCPYARKSRWYQARFQKLSVTSKTSGNRLPLFCRVTLSQVATEASNPGDLNITYVAALWILQSWMLLTV